MRSFAQLFAGRTDRYAIWRPSGEMKGKKVDGKGDTKWDAMPADAYEQHLAGKYMLGVIPIQLDGTVAWFAGDIDDYNIDILAFDKKCQELEIPVVVCRSKSGGAHIYCFVQGTIPAADAIRLMRQWTAQLGYPKSEVFPKQTNVDETNVGNWMNLPYFNAKKTERYAIGLSGEALTVDQFCQLAEARSIRPREVAGLSKTTKSITQDAKFKDAPPCIQQMIAETVREGGRNNTLAHMGVYCKMAYPEDWQAKVRMMNAEYFDPPLTDNEVNTIIRNIRPDKYQYLCKHEPMASMCNKDLCLTRKWGVGPQRGTEYTDYGDLKIGQLTMITSDPPVWMWDINDMEISFSTDQMTSPTKFRNRLMDILGILPPKMKGSEHDKMVAAAMKVMAKEDAPDDISLNGIVLDLFRQWTTALIPRTQKLVDVLKGAPFYAEDEKVILFRGSDFTSYYYRESKIGHSSRDIWSAMRKAGAETENRRIPAPELGPENQVKLWKFPVDKPWFTIPGKGKF